MNKIVYCVLLAMLPCMFSSCSSKIFGGRKKKKKADAVIQTSADTSKVSAITPAVNTTVPVATPGNAKLINELTPLWNNRMNFKTFSGKAKVNLEGPDLSHDLSVNFRIAKDKIIWVHITALGGLVNVARMYVTPDSFFMLSYQEKQATRLPLSGATKILPIPVKFNQLQNLLIGEPLADGTIVVAETKDSSWSLHTEDSNYLQRVVYLKKDSMLSFDHLQTRDPNGPQAMIDYYNYDVVNSRKISTKRMVHIQNGLKNYTLDMNFVNLEFDKELEFPFAIPGNYTVKTN